MTTWTEIPNTVFEVGKPARAVDMRALRDNITALAEGASGAPRLRVGALQRINAGNQIRSRYDAEVGADTQFNEVSFAFVQAGSIRVTVDLKRPLSGIGSVVVSRRRIENNVIITTFETSSSSYVTRTIDVPVLPGDLLMVRLSVGNMRNVRFMTNGEDLYPGSAASIEGNTYA